MATIGTQTLSSVWRAKYASSTLQHVLEKAMVAEKICNVDKSDLNYIHNPYSTQPTAVVQAAAGTYSVSAWSTSEDSLTVSDEVIYGVHVFDFERIKSRYDLIADRFDQLGYAVAYALDKWVLNNLCEDGTGAYTTPVGGFTTAANTAVIFSNLISKVSGFAETYNGLFIVLENTDITGIIQTQVGSGFSYADAALNNGFMGNYMGVDIYVVRSGTFVDATTSTVSGSKTWTNLNHRVFGVKKVATYASPRGIRYEEKGVSGKTGVELAVSAQVGFKLWAQMTDLVVDITLA